MSVYLYPRRPRTPASALLVFEIESYALDKIICCYVELASLYLNSQKRMAVVALRFDKEKSGMGKMGNMY